MMELVQTSQRAKLIMSGRRAASHHRLYRLVLTLGGAICLIQCSQVGPGSQVPSSQPTMTVAVTPASVVGGGTSQGVVTLSSVPAGGATILLSIAGQQGASVPSSVAIPSNGSSASFAVNTT